MLELKEMTVEQLLDSDEYRKALKVKIDNEIETHDRMMRVAFTKKLRLQRNPISSLREKNVMNVDDIIAAYKMILCKALQGFSATEREYIKVLCQSVYWQVVQEYQRETAQSK